MHLRKLIREAAKTQLSGITGVTLYESRVYPFSQLPAIAIYTETERVEIDESSMGRQQRILAVIIEIRAQASEDVDDELDRLAAEVEQAIAADQTLSGTCDHIEYAGMTSDFETGEQQTGLMSMEFAAEYRINPSNPTILV